MDRDARSPDLLSSLVAPSAGPITWPHEYHVLVNAIPMNASTGGQFARVKTDAYVPLEIDHASRTAAVDVIIGADNKSGRNAAQHGTSPPTLKLGMSNFVPTSSDAIASVSETASPLSVGLSNGPDSALPITESMIVTTDKPDYAPGDIATFVVAGVGSGSSVTFQVADLASAPGVNGIADVYAPFSVTDGGTGDADGLANGTVVATWQVPADGSATGATLQLTATSDGQTAITTFSDAPNKIVTENLNTGTPQSVWAIHGSIANQGDSQIEGFATQISTNAGQTVSFKIDTASSGYTLDIYRLGYYGGNGARLVTTMHHSGATNQPNPIFNSATNTVDAGNWSVTDSWTIPSTAASGVYFAKLTTDAGNFQNMIPFIVRNDGTASDILFQTSDTTWEAYNTWGGYNLYFGPDLQRSDRAYAVSYNRPIAMNSTVNGVGPQDFLFGEEYAAIYWLEQNGYNVSYISGIDAATNAGLLRNTKAYIDVGHDEYWSQSQFANVKAAADAGVNLAFLSGNQSYWDTALAPSFDSSHTANRTVVEYKDIWSGTQLDPNGTSNGGAGLFRDPVYGPGTPENSLSGTIFTVDGGQPLANISIPATMSQLRFWRNTSIASGNGGTLTGLLGFEWDSDLDNGFRPTGLIDLSSTTLNVGTLLLDNGLTDGPGTATHSLTLYRDTTSGALIFGAGTVMWSWGLSNQYAPYTPPFPLGSGPETAPVSAAVQQSMVNLFADMGVQPGTLQASLVLAQASSDHTSPTAVITSPSGGTNVIQGQTVTITGTASDVGGRVAGIEVSTDGGATWHPAAGTTNWSYTWTPAGPGTDVIEARATDDSVNLQSSPATVSVNVTSGGAGGGGNGSSSLFTASNTPAELSPNEGQQLEVGVKFQSSVAGQITALKFYRSPSDTDRRGRGRRYGSRRRVRRSAPRHVRRRRRKRLAKRELGDTRHDIRQHNLCRLLSHQRHLCEDRQLLHHRLHERSADCARHHHSRRQRRLRQCRNQHRRHLPDQHLPCRQLLGRRRFPAHEYQRQHRRHRPGRPDAHRQRVRRRERRHAELCVGLRQHRRHLRQHQRAFGRRALASRLGGDPHDYFCFVFAAERRDHRRHGLDLYGGRERRRQCDHAHRHRHRRRRRHHHGQRLHRRRG